MPEKTFKTQKMMDNLIISGPCRVPKTPVRPANCPNCNYLLFKIPSMDRTRVMEKVIPGLPLSFHWRVNCVWRGKISRYNEVHGLRVGSWWLWWHVGRWRAYAMERILPAVDGFIARPFVPLSCGTAACQHVHLHFLTCTSLLVLSTAFTSRSSLQV